MVFTTTLFCQILLAATALAIPTSNERLAARVQRRAAGSHLSRPMNLVDSVSTSTSDGSVFHDNKTSDNWSGAVLLADTRTFKSVTGTFTVPTPSSPSGVRGSGAASAWVGIDGATCTSAILQTGIDFTVTSGDYSFNAWYEYWPLPATDFTTMPIHAGDVIKLTVTATSSSTGIAVVENVTRGQTVSKTVTSPAPGSLLCQTNAEWIVEDYEEGSSLVPFADFGTVEFTEASATTSGGSMGPANATLINILQNNVILTTSSVSDNGVNVSYV